MTKLLDDIQVDIQIVITAQASIQIAESSGSAAIGFKLHSSAMEELQAVIDRHSGFFKSGKIEIMNREGK